MSGILTSTYNSVSFALSTHAKAIAKLQEQTATGARINRVSDDPGSAYQILGLDGQTRNMQNYMDNIAKTSDVLQVSSSVIENMMTALADAQTQITQITSGTYTQSGRELTAESINDILEQMVSLANTKNMNQYIFSGGKTTTAPYAVEKTNGYITSVTYQGSSQARNIEVAPSVQGCLMYVGENLFSNNDRTDPVFYGDTGAAAGSGTSSVKGDVWLTVTHNGSNYVLSTDGGTTQTIVPDSGDVSNIAVKNAAGQVLYVNATNIDTTGKNLVRVPGTYDVFGGLMSIRDILKNEQSLSEPELTEFRNAITTSLEEVKNNLSNKQVSIGSRIGFLENLNKSLEDMKFNTQDQAASLEEADITQIAIDLTTRETLYQMSLSVAGKLLSVSLLDFL